MSIKENVINKIIEIEGGYVDDPADSGGETNFGITIDVARKYGYMGPMRDLPKSLAFEIYSKRYWDSMELDSIKKIYPMVAAELVDTGINCGVGRASTFLQVALNAFNNQGKHYKDIDEDGDIGPGTLRALNAYYDRRGVEGGLVLFRALDSQQGAHYLRLSRHRAKDEKFTYGWYLHRIG